MLRFSLSLTKGAFALRAEAPEPCQRLALMGPSGVGKSMLLSALAGFESGAQGAVHLGCASQLRGKSWPRRAAAWHDVPAALTFSPSDRRRKSALCPSPVPPPVSLEEVVTRLNLAPVLHRRAHQLSGGEAQRVALGRALLAAPAWLLLDEPCANLDPVRREAALVLIDEVVEREGLTLVLATHRLEEAVSLCDHLLPLVEEDGVSTGTAQPLAQVLSESGAPTLVSGTLREAAGTLAFCYRGQTLRVKAAPFLRGEDRAGPAAALIDREDVRALPAGAPAPLGCPALRASAWCQPPSPRRRHLHPARAPGPRGRVRGLYPPRGHGAPPAGRALSRRRNLRRSASRSEAARRYSQSGRKGSGPLIVSKDVKRHGLGPLPPPWPRRAPKASSRALCHRPGDQ